MVVVFDWRAYHLQDKAEYDLLWQWRWWRVGQKGFSSILHKAYPRLISLCDTTCEWRFCEACPCFSFRNAFRYAYKKSPSSSFEALFGVSGFDMIFIFISFDRCFHYSIWKVIQQGRVCDFIVIVIYFISFHIVVSVTCGMLFCCTISAVYIKLLLFSHSVPLSSFITSSSNFIYLNHDRIVLSINKNYQNPRSLAFNGFQSRNWNLLKTLSPHQFYLDLGTIDACRVILYGFSSAGHTRI